MITTTRLFVPFVVCILSLNQALPGSVALVATVSHNKLLELKRRRVVANVRSHRCDAHLQAQLIAFAADQMRAQLDRTVRQFVVRQQVVEIEDTVDARKVVRSHVHRSNVRNLILHAGYENANLNKHIKTLFNLLEEKPTWTIEIVLL